MNQRTSIEKELERELGTVVEANLRPATGLRDAMRAADRPEPVRYVTRQAVLTRAADALHRVEQLTVQIEHAADDLERQLGTLKGRV